MGRECRKDSDCTLLFFILIFLCLFWDYPNISNSFDDMKFSRIARIFPHERLIIFQIVALITCFIDIPLWTNPCIMRACPLDFKRMELVMGLEPATC